MMVAELAKCQAQHKNGYLSAFPQEFFDRLRDGVNVWAPFYTIHKIMAGHLDMYIFAGNEQALDTAEKMARWVRSWSDPFSEQQMQRVLLVEYGGMGEVLANLYTASPESASISSWHSVSTRSGSSIRWPRIVTNSRGCTSIRTFRR